MLGVIMVPVDPRLATRFRWFVCLMLVTAAATAQDHARLAPAVGVDPIIGIIEALRSHTVVAVGEGVGHGNEQGHALLRSLIRDPGFARAADDIVVEWGNSLYQDVVDRFTRGENVAHDELRKVWENTTQPHPVWDSPIYWEFFQTVRSQNETLPEEDRLRVLLGDPPVDWESGDARKQMAALFRQRDAYPAELIRREVIEKGRRALVVYGGMHLARLPRPRNTFIANELADEFPSDTLVSLLASSGIEVFNVWGVPAEVAAQVQPEIASWSPVRLTLIENTLLGAAPFQRYFPGGDAAPMQEQFKALMVFGPSSTLTWSSLSPELCTDEYVEMRVRRMNYDDPQAFILQYCQPSSAD
jgi:hypothetical protein